MADYIYLLETRLSKEQQAALASVRAIAREHELTVFLVGGAIRDLISGAPVRDLDVAVQGNALKLKKDLEKAGGEFSAENAAMQQLHFRFPGGVRLEIGSTLTTLFPKPGRVSAKPTTILEDLRRRDFTANAMALSLNEGSYGLLMDPLNGVADIENREFRLVSNYGFIEDPVRLIRAARLMARLGWSLDEKTRTRYETAKEENYVAAMQSADRAYELEELFHEEDPLRVMHRLEEEGWLHQLSSVLSVGKANTGELTRLRDTQAQLQEQAVLADAAAANFPLLTAKLSAKDVQALKDSFPRKGFVREIDSLDQKAKEFAGLLGGKQASLPSQAFRLITENTPVVVLWAAFSSKNASVQAKFKSFSSEWPQNRQRLPYLLLQEMRITPDLPGYDELLQKVFFALMDGQLETPEAMRAFLEPYSPPAPPPPVSLRRPRAAKTAKKEPRASKSRKKPEEVPQQPADLDPGNTPPVVTPATGVPPAPEVALAPEARAAVPRRPEQVTPKPSRPVVAEKATRAPAKDKVPTPLAKPAKPSSRASRGSAKPVTPSRKKTTRRATRPAIAGRSKAKGGAQTGKPARSPATIAKRAPTKARVPAGSARSAKKIAAVKARRGSAKPAASSRSQAKGRGATKRPRR